MALPNLSDLVCVPGNPATAEWFNEVPLFALAFQEDFMREHRPEDGEHKTPAPQAAGTVRWDGSKYVVVGDARNIESVYRNGPGDVTVTLKVSSVLPEEWFPRVVPLDFHGFGWEYDDTFEVSSPARTAKRCRVRIAEYSRDYVPSGEPAPDPVPKDGSFRFEAYFPERQPGPTGIGDSPEPALVREVRERICQDGVESAAHRNKLYRFCDWLRGSVGVDHKAEAEGREGGVHKLALAPGHMPLAVAYLRPPIYTGAEDEPVWMAGEIESAGWHSGAPVEFVATQKVRWAHATLRFRSPGIPALDYRFERTSPMAGKVYVTAPFRNPKDWRVGLVVFGR